MSGYTRPTMVGEAPPVMEDYPGYSTGPPTWARLRPSRPSNNALTIVDTWSSKPSNHAGVNGDRKPTGPLPRKVLKAKLPAAPQAPAPARSSRSTDSSEQWSSSFPIPHGLPAVLEMTEDESLDFDTSETASMSSELSTSTQATSVASDDTVTAKDGSKLGARNALKVIHPAPTATVARVKPRLRTRPLTTGDTSTTVTPRSPATSRRTLHIQVTPSQDPTPQHKKVEKDLRLRIDQLEAESQSLRDEQTRLIKELDDTSDRLSTTGVEKEEVEKERNRERDTRQLLYSDLEDKRKALDDFRNKFAAQKAITGGVENERDLLLSDLEEQRRILDEFRNNFDLQRGMLQEAEKERDELREAKELFEHKATKLETELKQALEERKDHEGLLIAQIAALELTKGAQDSRIDTRDKEISDLIASQNTLKKESEEQQARINALTEEKDAQFKTLTEEKEAQAKTLTEEKAILLNEKKSVEEEKEEAVARITELSNEKEKEKQELQAKISSVEAEAEKLRAEVNTLTSDKETLQKQIEALEVEQTEHETAINTLTIDLGGAKDANVHLASQKLDADAELAKAKKELATAQSQVTTLEEVKKALEVEIEELKSRPAEIIKVEEAPSPNTMDEGAPTSDNSKELAAEVARVVGLTAANVELETKAAELQAEADKVAGLVKEKSALEAKKAELEEQASHVPALTEQNKTLAAQLADANTRLGQVQAAHQAAVAQVHELQAQVSHLRARQPSQSRQASPKSRSSSRKRKPTESKALVAVRSSSDRGSLQIMRKCDLRPTSPKRSSASVTDSES